MVDGNNKIQHQAAKTPHEGCHPAQCYEDEISLLDIWRVLVNQRKWIFGITLAVTLSAVVYALSAPGVYKAEAIILPPDAADIIGSHIPALKSVTGESVPDLDGITAEAVFKEMVQNLNSRSLQRQFFENHKSIVGTLAVSNIKGKGGNPGSVSVTMEGNDPEMLAKGVNDFIAVASEDTARFFLEAFKTEQELHKAEIRNKIEELRKNTRQQRLDRIMILEEAYSIASKLGVSDYVAPFSDSPLYLRGTKALSAEIEVLRKRKNDDHFISELPELQNSLFRLEQEKVEASRFAAAKIDQPALPPTSPFKPDRKKIVVLAFIAGLMLSILVAFIANFIETNVQNKRDG